MCPEAPRSDPGGREGWFLLLLVLVGFNLVKAEFIVYSLSDENIYFYMGKLVSQGYAPYRDFRFAHPPLRLLPPAIVFWAAGFSFTLLKLLPILATNAAAVLLYLIVRRAAGVLSALVATAGFLFSFVGLYYTSYYLGYELGLALLLGGFLLGAKERHLAAGALFGLAALAGLYVAPALIGYGVHLVCVNRRRVMRVAIGFLAVFLPVNLACGVVGGESFFRSVYLFHFMKTPDPAEPQLRVLLNMLLLNPVLICLPLLYPLFRKRALDPLALAALASLAFLAAYPSIHDSYLLLSAPFLAALGAVVLVGLIRLCGPSPAAAGLAAGLLLAVFGGLHLEYTRAAVARSSAPRAPEMARLAAEVTPEGGHLFGHSGIVPLLALLSDREVLDRHVDSNGKVYVTGLDNLDRVIQLLSSEQPVLVVSLERAIDADRTYFTGPMLVNEFRRFVWARSEVLHRAANYLTPLDQLVFYLVSR